MTENENGGKPLLWLVDSEQNHLDACVSAFAGWAEARRGVWNSGAFDWDSPPDAVFFSAEIPGGANSEFFAGLVESAGGIPLLAVARLRSLAQAVAYFRAGAADYLSLPLEEADARERFAAALERAARLAVQNAVIEVEETPEEDILAQIQAAEPPAGPEWIPPSGFVNSMPVFSAKAEAAEHPENPDDFDEEVPENLLFADIAPDDDPVAVDGLPIPSLWEELPCGLLLFDSLGNLVFSNRAGLDLFGCGTLAALQDALENSLSSFAAHGLNNRPFPDNQWPHILAVKTRAPRSAVVSVEKSDRRRSWLRIDCQPHLADGNIARLSMTVVNLTGELPPLQLQPPETEKSPSPPPSRKDRKDKSKHRGRKKG